MPLDSRAIPTTATNSATYFVNSRLRILPRDDAAAGAAGAITGAASVLPWGVSGWREIVIGPQFIKKARACLLPRCGRLLDDLVRKGQEGRGHFQVGGLGRLEVNDEEVAGRLLERQVGRIGPFEDAVDQCRRSLERFRQIGPVRHQPAIANVKVIFVDGRQSS